MPKISVIIPVLNSAGTLGRCLNSVTCQTYPNKEIIVIDGGSTDGSLEILGANNHCIDYWISEPDGSIYEAFNKGLQVASGDWVYFLGADDNFWHAQVLSDMATYLRAAYPHHMVVYGRAAVIDEDGMLARVFGAPWSTFSVSLAGAYLCHQGFFYHRKLFERVGQYDQSFQISGDYELILRSLKLSEPLYVPKILVAAWRRGGTSTDPKNRLKQRFERQRATENNGVQPSWRSYVERILYVGYKNILSLNNPKILDLFLRSSSFIVNVDRRIRKY